MAVVGRISRPTAGTSTMGSIRPRTPRRHPPIAFPSAAKSRGPWHEESAVPGRASEREERAIRVCYLCGKRVDAWDGSGDHVIPRTLLGDRPPKVKGFDYGGKVRTHRACNNRFGDEMHVRKAL